MINWKFSLNCKSFLNSGLILPCKVILCRRNFSTGRIKTSTAVGGWSDLMGHSSFELNGHTNFIISSYDGYLLFSSLLLDQLAWEASTLQFFLQSWRQLGYNICDLYLLPCRCVTFLQHTKVNIYGLSWWEKNFIDGVYMFWSQRCFFDHLTNSTGFIGISSKTSLLSLCSYFFQLYVS